MSRSEAAAGPIPVAPQDTLDGVFDVVSDELSAERIDAHFVVTDRHRQRFGIVHGGTYAACAESLASEATNLGVADRGCIGVGLSNATSFVRPVFAGSVRISGRPRHRGRTTWVWDVDFEDPDGRLCATSRVTVAVIAAPAGALAS